MLVRTSADELGRVGVPVNSVSRASSTPEIAAGLFAARTPCIGIISTCMPIGRLR